MKYFITRIIFSAGFMLLLLAMCQVFFSLIIRGKSITEHDNLEQTSNVNADLVFLGSSRCAAHFNPKYFDTAFSLKSINIGVDGHSELTMAFVRLSDYLSRNKPPKVALLNFDPFVSSGSFDKNSNFVHKNDFARYAFMPNEKDKLVVDYFKFNAYEKYIPLFSVFKYKLFQNLYISNKVNVYREFGYLRHDEVWDTIIDPISDNMKNHYFKLSEVKPIESALGNLKKLCKLNGINLICMQTPVYKVCYDKDKFLQTAIICKKLDIPFFDLNSENIRNNISYFYNSNHLNEKGVNALNSMLGNDSLLMGILKLK